MLGFLVRFPSILAAVVLALEQAVGMYGMVCGLTARRENQTRLQ